MNGSLHTIDGRHVLRFERRLRHPVEKVWRAITDPAEMAHWFPAGVEIVDFRVGGRMLFPVEGAETTEGTITELDPPRIFAFDWNGEPMRLELRPDGEGSVLTFTHAFTDRPMAGSFATGWETCLGALERALDGSAPQEAAGGRPERYAERHDAYVAAFDLGEGTVREGTDGVTVRFERLLPHPADEVWAALTDGRTPAPGEQPPPAAGGAAGAAGALTAVEEEKVLEYAAPSGGGRVRWELTGGHPAGTRVVLIEALPADRVAALAAWHAHLEALAARLRGQDGTRSRERVAELRRHYAERAR